MPLPAASLNAGDGASYTPPGTVVASPTGAVTVVAAGGRATIDHGRFTLRRIAHRIALLVLAPPQCARSRTTRIGVQGPFTVQTGRLTLRNVSRRALVSIHQRCRQPTRLHVIAGRIEVTQPRP